MQWTNCTVLLISLFFWFCLFIAYWGLLCAMTFWMNVLDECFSFFLCTLFAHYTNLNYCRTWSPHLVWMAFKAFCFFLLSICMWWGCNGFIRSCYSLKSNWFQVVLPSSEHLLLLLLFSYLINWVCPIVALVKENPFNICATIDTTIMQKTFELFNSITRF